MDQQEYQRLMSELNYYQDLLGQVEQSLENLVKTKNDLKEFEEEPSKEVLAPIANGVYVEAELKNKKLFVNVGSEIVTVKSVGEAIIILDKQEKEIMEDKNKVVEKIESCYLALQKKGE